MNVCLVCKTHLKRKSNKYCSNKCQRTYQYYKYIENWKSGIVTGSRGIIAKNISQHLKRYLAEKYGEKCSLCDWNKRNEALNKVPLEIDHINGNSDDNTEENLRLICPNCHALSKTFRNLNKGRGRLWRRNKYNNKNT